LFEYRRSIRVSGPVCDVVEYQYKAQGTFLGHEVATLKMVDVLQVV
jgi:hypothetical protein